MAAACLYRFIQIHRTCMRYFLFFFWPTILSLSLFLPYFYCQSMAFQENRERDRYIEREGAIAKESGTFLLLFVFFLKIHRRNAFTPITHTQPDSHSPYKFIASAYLINTATGRFVRCASFTGVDCGDLSTPCIKPSASSWTERMKVIRECACFSVLAWSLSKSSLV